MFELILVLVFSYLLGSISTAVLVSKAFGLPDPRDHGSKNPGATNVLRTAGKTPAIMVLLGDAAKGYVPIFLVNLLGWPPLCAAAAMTAVVFGHVFPVFFQFRGGKGVATALGAMLALSPAVAMLLMGVWLAVVMKTRYVSLASLVSAFCAPLFVLLYFSSALYFWASFVVSVVLVWRHRENIQRLRAGIERKLGEKPVTSVNAETVSTPNLHERIVLLKTEEDTLKLAADLAGRFAAPLIATFSGELGVGKTTFIRGILQASGYTGRVKSPSFALLESYALNGKEFHHFDLYRVQNPQELSEFGIEECLAEPSIVLVEWPEHDHFYFTRPDLAFYFQYEGENRRLKISAETESGRKILRMFS